ARHGCRLGRTLRFSSGVLRRRLGGLLLAARLAWDPHDEFRSFRAGAGDVDGAAMLLDDLLHGGQAEADAEALRGEQRLEDLRQRLRRDTGTAVDDRQPAMGACRL